MNSPSGLEAYSDPMDRLIRQAGAGTHNDSLGDKSRRSKRPAPAPTIPADIPNYEPLIRHSSRAEWRFLENNSTQRGEIEIAKMDFYINYFQKKPERLTAIGIIIPKGQHPDSIIRAYVTAGFVELPETQRNNCRKESMASSTLAKATTAWQQHLKRSGLINQRQIAVFVTKELHQEIQAAYLNRLKGLPIGETITLDRVVADLLKKALK